jgi:HAD superfamily hydrolase (TIGR01458 family)
MIEGLLLDMDGVLTLSFEAMPGAAETMAWIRRHAIPFRVVTNTTTHTRADLATALRRADLEVEPDEIVTAVVGTAQYLRSHHDAARVLLLSDGDARADLEGVHLVGPADEADVVVLGGASDEFTHANLDHAFRQVMNGATLVGMHRNLYWRTSGGLELDGGAYLVGLEAAAGVEATVCGKPSSTFFESALSLLGLPPARVAMVGDDILNDVLGAQACGMTGVLVRTGKFMESDLDKGVPDHVLATVAELPELLRP